MKNIEVEFEKISNDVKKFINKLKPYNEYYCGIQILFSPIQYKPKILFLGYNPGYGTNKEQRFSIPQRHDYAEPYYQLGTKIYNIFKKANKEEVIKNSVISNIFYIATDGCKSHGLFHKSLYKDIELYNEYIEKSKDWTKQLIKIISPEIIICTMYGAFEHLIEWVDINPEFVINENDYKYYYKEKMKIIGLNRMNMVLNFEMLL